MWPCFVRSTAELLFVGIVAMRMTAKPDWLESEELAGRARTALGRGTSDVLLSKRRLPPANATNPMRSRWASVCGRAAKGADEGSG